MLGLIGAVLLAIGDFLVGAVETSATDTGLLLNRASYMLSNRRLALSMLLAIFGTIFLVFGLYELAGGITDRGLAHFTRRTMIAGSVSWIFLHFLFCGSRMMYKVLFDAGLSDAYELVNRAIAPFRLVIIVCVILIALPFVLYFIALLTGKTQFPKWYLLFYLILPVPMARLLALIFKQTQFGNGLRLAANHLAIAVWMLIAYLYLRSRRKTKRESA